MSNNSEKLPELTPDMRKLLRLAQWEAERDHLHCGLIHLLSSAMILYGDDLPSQIQLAADRLKR